MPAPLPAPEPPSPSSTPQNLPLIFSLLQSIFNTLWNDASIVNKIYFSTDLMGVPGVAGVVFIWLALGYSGKTDLHDSWKLLPLAETAKTLLCLALKRGREHLEWLSSFMWQLQELVGCDLPSSSLYQRTVHRTDGFGKCWNELVYKYHCGTAHR